MKQKKVENIVIKKNEWYDDLRQDSIFIESKLVDLKDLTGMPVRKGLSKALISEGEIVNIVSPAYGHMPNEVMFYEVEHKLIEAGIKYVTRSINRDNKSFAVDYILNDDSFFTNIKTGSDTILPMLRFTNAYDGSGPCAGSFGFFRKVCENGLHVAQTKVGFGVRHKSKVHEIVLPGIKGMVDKFMDNEFYSLHKKFEVLAETPVLDLNEFVRYTATKMNLFRYEASEKNPDTPSSNAQIVIDTIKRESQLLGSEPNMWLGYNAFNEFLHSGGKSFGKQQSIDKKLFGNILEMAN